MTALAVTSWPTPRRTAVSWPAVAGLALWMPMLLSPVSQLAPRGAAAKLPMVFEAGLVAVLLLRWLLARQPAMGRTLLVVGVAALHATLTGLWAIDERIFLTYGVRAAHGVAWTFAIFGTCRTHGDLVVLLRWLWVGAVVAAAVGIAQWVLPSLQVDFMRENTEGAVGAALVWESELGSGAIVRVTGTLAHPLGLAMLLGLTLPWTPVVWAGTRSPLLRAGVLAGAAVQLAGLGLTYSRMAVFGLLLSTAMWALRGGIRHPGVALAGLLAAGVACLPLLPATLVERVFDPTHLRESDSLLARLEMQLYGSDLGHRHGFLGLGYGCYGPAYEATAMGRYVEQARWMRSQEDWSSYDLGDIGAHNTFLEVWVEQGVPGLVLLGVVIVRLLRGLWRLAGNLPRGGPARSVVLCMEATWVGLFLTCCVLHVQEAIFPWVWAGLACATLRVYGAPGEGGVCASSS